MPNDIQVYGADWCGLTYSLRHYLTTAHIAHDFHDVDRDLDARELMFAFTDGRRRFPLVVVHERVLANPSRDELQRVLDDYRIRPAVRRRAAAAALETPPRRPRQR